MAHSLEIPYSTEHCVVSLHALHFLPLDNSSVACCISPPKKLANQPNNSAKAKQNINSILTRSSIWPILI